MATSFRVGFEENCIEKFSLSMTKSSRYASLLELTKLITSQ